MKYLLMALIITHTSGDHGPPITRDLGEYESMRECERESELMRALYQGEAVWMEPNAEPESIAYVRYLCKPVLEQ